MAFSSSSSSQSPKHDVFLSFSREAGVLKTFVVDLYSVLEYHKIDVYKEDQTLPPMDQPLFKAIEESRIAIIIFSKNYTDSSQFLDEVTHIIKCRDEKGLLVLPIFYHVEPSEVSKQKGDLENSLAKQVMKKVTEAELWRNTLIDAFNPYKRYSGNESQFLENIVDTTLDKLFAINFGIDEYLVGMRTRLQDLESLLDVGSHDVRTIGIWGMGGSGKTTLATSLYKKISKHFHGHCIVGNIREESTKYGLEKLQENLIRAVSKINVKVHSIAEGTLKIKNILCHRKVLVLLDDVDTLEQLDALVGSHSWFGSGSKIIIITRDEHLLRVHKVDHVYPIISLSRDEAIRLFERHAYNEQDPIDGRFSSYMVGYTSSLPLSLKVLGPFLHDQDMDEWNSIATDVLNSPIPVYDMKVLERCYNGLETYLKELFLNIACFFRGWKTDEAMEILEACNLHPEIGIKVLRQKNFISIVDGRFDMHDLIQEMGHYIVKQDHGNPKQCSIVCNHEEIKDMCFRDPREMENNKIEVIKYDGYSHDHDHSSSFCMIVSKMKKLKWLSKAVYSAGDIVADGPSFLSSELRYIHWEAYPACPFPDDFQPMKLAVLKLWGSMQKEIWKGNKHLPRLKVLQLKYMSELLNTPNFDELPCLQKLTLCSCKELEEIHPSLGNLASLEYLSVSECPKLRTFPSIIRMKNLKTLEIKDSFLGDGEIPIGIGELSNLNELILTGNEFSRLDFSVSQLTSLKVLDVSYCVKLLELPELPSNLKIVKADYCSSLTSVGDCHRKCKQLCDFSLMGGGIVNDGGSLLQSMLEGKAIENDYMLLRVKGIEVAKEFKPPLLRGRRCRLQLLEKWWSDFCGLLICVVLPSYLRWSDPLRIVMSHATSSMNSEDDVVWEEIYGDSDKHTFVWYVPFGSLRHGVSWDQTYKALEFNIQDYRCCGFGVRLVAKKSESATRETSSYFIDYISRSKIDDYLESDSTFNLSFDDSKQ